MQLKMKQSKILKFSLLRPTYSSNLWNLSFHSGILKISLVIRQTHWVKLILKFTQSSLIKSTCAVKNETVTNFVNKLKFILFWQLATCAVKNETVANFDDLLEFALFCPTSLRACSNLNFHRTKFKILLNRVQKFTQTKFETIAGFNNLFYSSRLNVCS